MTILQAAHALLAEGWARNVVLTIAPDGTITHIQKDAGPLSGEVLPLLLPGMANAHSHAFQRALAGLTEHRSSHARHRRDDFWSWRRAMYGAADRLSVEDLGVIARHLYIEMVRQGYTSVAEFHYLHRPEGSDPAGLASSRALEGAARAAGIALTLVPTLYRYAGFDRSAPAGAQRRFALERADFASLVRTLINETEEAEDVTIGIGFHSLRAVDLADIVDILEAVEGQARPKHIHIAEQEQEVEDCRHHLGRPPVTALLERVTLDRTWTLVHATHAEGEELREVARRGAVIALCPTTEANLGDGLFPLADLIGGGGRFAIGSDSHVAVDPAAELCLLEYGARLARRRRLVGLTGAAAIHSGHVATALWHHAAQSGARALGLESGLIAPGKRADLVVLADDHPQLAGRTGAAALDTCLFGGIGPQVRDVMVRGRWVVRNGRHAGEEEAAAAYRAVQRRLHAAGGEGGD